MTKKTSCLLEMSIWRNTQWVIFPLNLIIQLWNVIVWVERRWYFHRQLFSYWADHIYWGLYSLSNLNPCGACGPIFDIISFYFRCNFLEFSMFKISMFIFSMLVTRPFYLPRLLQRGQEYDESEESVQLEAPSPRKQTSDRTWDRTPSRLQHCHF